MYNSSSQPDAPRSTDSWIEISSRPSNSSLSSASPDDMVTTGLHIQDGSGPRRSRHHQSRRSPLYLNLDAGTGPASVGGGSSQDEYEESESESDRVMTSSNEGLPYRPSSATSESPPEDLEDADADPGAPSALTGDQQCFTPQPNAFSHPPSSSSRQRASVPDSYFPPARAAPSTTQQHSYPGDRRSARSPYSATSPGYHADHDAALRASLTTLLSCAAAARSLPKKSTDATTPAAGRAQHPSPARIDTATLRMVPESVALRAAPAPPYEQQHGLSQAPSHRQRRLSASSRVSSSPRELSPATAQLDKNKRKATNNAPNPTANAADGAARSSSKDRRAAKKPRRQVASTLGASGTVDPTLLTWVVSAGVLVLVSALSFSAGYVTGREAGYAEAGAGGALREGAARDCGREVGRGLRRLRWGVTSGATASVRA